MTFETPSALTSTPPRYPACHPDPVTGMIGPVTTPIPRDDRPVPRWARAFAVVAIAAGAAVAFALAADAGPDARPWLVVLTYVAAVAATLGALALGMEEWARTGRHPRRTGVATFAVLLLAVAGFVVAVPVGWAAVTGWVAGILGSSLVSIPILRRNRGAVDAYWAERRRAATVEAAEAPGARGRRAPGRRGRPAPVGTMLRGEITRARRRLLAVTLAALLVTGGFVAVFRSEPAFWMTAGVAAFYVLWEVRGIASRRLALRAYEAGRSRPRVAWVALLYDPAPRMVRPLLAVWDERPEPGPGRYPKPDRVYRADDEADDLLSFQQSMEVHEAWVPASREPFLPPRWVVADAGAAIPQRRALFGRWYFGMLSRGERSEPIALRAGEPDPMAEAGAPTPPWALPSVRQVAGYAGVLGFFAGLFHLVVLAG